MSTQSLMNHLPGLWAFFFSLKPQNPCLRNKVLRIEIQAPKERPGSILKAASLFWKLWNQTDKQITPAARVTVGRSKRHCFLEVSPALAKLPFLFLPIDNLYIDENRGFLTFSEILNESHSLDTTRAQGKGRKRDWDYDHCNTQYPGNDESWRRKNTEDQLLVVPPL